jgi:hypothetical protein
MMAYAENTTVAFEKSIAEIIGLLRKAGADRIGQMEDRASFTLGFEMADRQIKFVVSFPDKATIQRLTGPRQDASKVEEQWRRQRGRALLLVIKAKLESVESEVETFEQAFLANVVLPGGSTVYEQVSGPISIAYKTNAPGVLLLGRS